MKLSEFNDSIKYKTMDYYTTKIKEAETPLDILVNTDYLTDLIDIELNKRRVLNNGKKRRERNEKLVRIGFK